MAQMKNIERLVKAHEDPEIFRAKQIKSNNHDER